jgi:hypothetical protein
MRQDDSLDGRLTALGREQARSVMKHSSNRHFRVDLVVGSLSLHHADCRPRGTVGSSSQQPAYVTAFGEINGLLLNA